MLMRISLFLQLIGLGQEHDKNYSMEVSAETETESTEYKAENKPQTSFPTTSTPSSRKFTDAAQYKSTSQKE